MNLAAIDLNLLVVLRALLETRSVTAAARRVGLSQPAASHALSRLRDLLGDPLLVRSGRALVPTPRAEAMRPRLGELLAGVEDLLEGPGTFDPKTARRRFSIGTSDYGQFVVLPPLLARVSAAAPGVDLWVRDLSVRDFEEPLRDGEIDVVLAPIRQDRKKPPLRAERLFTERFVCVVREGHPRVRARLTLEAFTELPHAFIAPRGTSGGVVDDALAKLGLERRVALAVPHFLVTPHIVASSDLVLTLAERVARSFAGHLPLRVVRPPLELPTFDVNLIWHERTDADPAHAWLRRQIMDVGRAT